MNKIELKKNITFSSEYTLIKNKVWNQQILIFWCCGYKLLICLTEDFPAIFTRKFILNSIYFSIIWQ